jgi:hypothetical protein
MSILASDTLRYRSRLGRFSEPRHQGEWNVRPAAATNTSSEVRIIFGEIMLRLNFSCYVTALLALQFCATCSVLLAEEPTATEDVEARRAVEAQQNAEAEVLKYKFATGDGDEVELQRQPILKWSNPAAGSIHGNVFLWTQAGRPLAAGSVYQWFSPFTHRSHEFISLATKPLRAQLNGTDVWKPAEAGVTLTALAGTPPPAATPVQRLIQMRSLLREFSAIKVARDGEQQELRALTQPVYRYTTGDASIIDGALFVFVQGTDPEVWLILEAHERDGREQWEFAAARMNSVQFSLQRKGATLWHVNILPWAAVQSHRETYTTFTFKELPSR